ncbi:MAG: threonine synthase [Ignavibacteriaceae bacterium]|nr:threonine synthase [Ignavibacteriaceae bacterium]
MKYFSTNNQNNLVSFREAVLKGLADDGGLFMPENIPQLSISFLHSLKEKSFSEISLEIASKFISEEEIPSVELTKKIDESINFPAPLIPFNNSLNVLELFHGPTLAFKDFGARFMAQIMSYFIKDSDKEMNILVATSGDTGSAVAHGFYDVEGIRVYLLYPKNKVSLLQEKQLTTLDKNITALEIDGTFDDCQRLVKSAFVDPEVKNKLKLSSANSISIARLIPQIFYYFESYKQLEDLNRNIYISVPSGNLGNLTGGLIAKKMGLPITKFIGATNANSVFTDYLKNGNFIPRPSLKTFSNAMDVGNPSNLARIIELFNRDISLIREVIFSSSYSDDETIDAIKEVSEIYDYIIDPHAAVAYLALKNFTKRIKENYSGIIVGTAHPAKFKDIVESATGFSIEMPEALLTCLNKEKKTIELSSDYSIFKDYLLSLK